MTVLVVTGSLLLTGSAAAVRSACLVPGDPSSTTTSPSGDPKAALMRRLMAFKYRLNASNSKFEEPNVEKAFKLAHAKSNCQVPPAAVVSSIEERLQTSL